MENKLQKDDLIGIISPCYPVNKGQYDDAIKGLKALGYRVVLGKNLYKNTYGYSATEKERAYDFNDMIVNKDVKMILFGGGYAGNEIVPYIDYESIIKNPKLIVSYSDGTNILNTITSCTGLKTYYGQRPSTFVNITKFNRKSFENNFVLTDCKEVIRNSDWNIICPGKGEGQLIGGYLENFSFMIGNPYFRLSDNQKYILFLEDYVDFNPLIKVSMYLSNIEQSSLMRNVTGLLFGHYSDDKNEDLFDRLYRFGSKHRIPVLQCDDFGHGKNNGIIQIGSNAVLDSKTRSLRYLQ